MPTAAIAALLITFLSAQALTQLPRERGRAQVELRLGRENMKVEKFEEAVKNFQQAIALDPAYEEAYYWLGRADMALKRFPEAIAAYTKCRDLYQAQTGRQFSSLQEAQRIRRERMIEIDDSIRYVQNLPQTARTQDQLRQLQDYRRRQEEFLQRGSNMSIENTVPAWVSLALGSAHFRAGHMNEAEQAYKAAIEADPKTGEAHQNLAVVYMTTARYAEAERALDAARKVGFKVNPALEAEIRAKKKG